MKLNYRAGRATIAALSLACAAVVIGGLLLPVKALGHQRGDLDPIGINAYGPAVLPPVSTSTTSKDPNTHCIIIVCLPAVQSTAYPFRLQVLNDDAEIVLPIQTDTAHYRKTFQFDVFTTLSSSTARGLELHVVDVATGKDTTHETGSYRTTVRLLPAVQRGGAPIGPIGISTTLQGVNKISLADGSVLPVPFEFALPAVQDQL